MNKLMSFFEESPGSLSSNRLIFIVGSFYSMLMGAWIFYETKDFASSLAFVTSVSGVYAGSKLIQKNTESKSTTP